LDRRRIGGRSVRPFAPAAENLPKNLSTSSSVAILENENLG
jgi:hypothetical protein